MKLKIEEQIFLKYQLNCYYKQLLFEYLIPTARSFYGFQYYNTLKFRKVWLI